MEVALKLKPTSKHPLKICEKTWSNFIERVPLIVFIFLTDSEREKAELVLMLMHFKEASQVQVHLGDGQTVQRQCRQSFFNTGTSPFISEVRVPQTDKQTIKFS